MKNKKYLIFIIALGGMLLAGSVYFLGLFRVRPSLRHISVPFEYSLPVTSAMNLRQGTNQCGPYAASVFLSAIQAKGNTHPEHLVKILPWKLPRGYTHPRALESLLRKYGIDTISLDAEQLSDADKIRFLQEKISSGNPVILLTYMYGYQHYITLLGYRAAQEEFFVYDPVFTRGKSGMTIDENGELPGNRTISADDLLSDWSQGGIAGWYTWYALTAR